MPNPYLAAFDNFYFTALPREQYPIPQLFAMRQFTYFTDLGRRHRMYLAELGAWGQQLDERRTTAPQTTYEASGSPVQGMQPTHLETVTPGRHPEEIYKTLRWLRE